MTTYLRADRAVFRFSGPDAHKLVNDVVTGHIPHEPGTAFSWALLSPQGKILAEGLASFEADALLLDVHDSVADDFFKRMRMYKLRAKAEIEDLRATHRVGFSTASGERDRAGPVQLGYRVIAPIAETSDWVADDAAYHRARIAAGIAHQGNDFAANDTFAHDIGMDMLEGIDFAKGCYVGQEVVSRMKHRGTARRRPVIVSGIDAPSGSAVLASGREAGTVGQVVDGQAVATIRLDRITDPAAVTVDGKPVSLRLPDWASYQFGEKSTEELRGILESAPSAKASASSLLTNRGQMSRQSTRAWQRMLSGRRLDILDPSPVDVELSDIAHGLARVARWNGQTTGDYPFSVAQHSVLVLELFRAANPGMTPALLLQALLHDAPEYVMGDIISPFKAAMGGNYKDVENRLLSAIYLRFSLPATMPAAIAKLVKKADREAAYFEATHLAGFEAAEARKLFGVPEQSTFDVDAFEQLIRPWPTHQAHGRFIEAFEAISKSISGA